METRNIALTLDKAQEWYNSGNDSLKEVALQAFTEEELKTPEFKKILTFKDACNAVGISYADFCKMLKGFYGENIFKKTPASIAAMKMNIIRQALNKGQNMSLTKGTIWYPQIRFATLGSKYYNSELNSGYMVKAGTFRLPNGDLFNLLSGLATDGGNAGLGSFSSGNGVGCSTAHVGFLGCATQEIAEHMSKHFAKEIFEAMYSDMVDFEWV